MIVEERRRRLAAEKADDTQVFRCNPTNAVGGSFVLGLHGSWASFLNPTNAVGGLFILSLALIKRNVNPRRELG